MRYISRIKKGHKRRHEGSDKMLDLVTRMLSDGWADEVMCLQTDEDLYQDMLKKYNLQDSLH